MNSLPTRTPEKYRMSIRLNFPLANKDELIKFDDSITVPTSETDECYMHARDNYNRLVNVKILIFDVSWARIIY